MGSHMSEVIEIFVVIAWAIIIGMLLGAICAIPVVIVFGFDALAYGGSAGAFLSLLWLGIRRPL